MSHHDDSWNNGYNAGIESGKHACAEEMRKLREELATARELLDLIRKRNQELLVANNSYQQEARDARDIIRIKDVAIDLALKRNLKFRDSLGEMLDSL
jgi:hypothetical protein